MSNTLAFQLFSLKDYEGGWDAAFEAVKGLGIDTIEVWRGLVPANSDAREPIRAMRASLHKAGMKLTCGHLRIEDFKAHYEAWKKLLLDFGSTDWVIPFAKAEDLAGWLALLPEFREMADRLQADGLSLGYHNHSAELAKLGDKYVLEHLLDAMPQLKVQFHIGQFLPARGIRLSDWMRKYEGRICSLHVNDADSQGEARVGQGECRAEESIKTALDAGVDTFIIEMRLTRDTLDGVKRDVEFTRNLIR